MTFTADDYRKAAAVLADHWRGRPHPVIADLQIAADRMDAEAAEKAKFDEQLEELAEALYRGNPFSQNIFAFSDHSEERRNDYRHQARAILSDGRWKRVEE